MVEASSRDEKGAGPPVSRPLTLAIWAILASNMIMVVVELVAGQSSGSAALKVDAIALSACVAHCSLALFAARLASSIRAHVEMVGVILSLGLGLCMLAITGSHFLSEDLPQTDTMGAVGLLAAATGFVSLGLLAPLSDCRSSTVWIGAKRRAWVGAALIVAAFSVLVVNSALLDLGLACALSAVVVTVSSTNLPGVFAGVAQHHRRQ